MPLAGLVGIHHSPAPGPSGTLPELLKQNIPSTPPCSGGWWPAEAAGEVAS